MEFKNQNPNHFLMLSKEDLRAELLKMMEEMMQKPAPKIWVSTEEAMELLHLKSKTSMQKLRDSGAIIFSQPMKKVILYNYESILKYLQDHSHKTF
jgi:hypothetical protein